MLIFKYTAMLLSISIYSSNEFYFQQKQDVLNLCLFVHYSLR